MEWTKTELKHAVVAVLLLTFIFGFNDGSVSFEGSSYVLNLLRVALAAVIILFLYASVQKILSKSFGASAEFNVWWIQRYYWYPESTLPRRVNFFGKQVMWNRIYIGPILGVVITLISLGKAFFCPIASMIVSEQKKYRADRKFPHMLESERAKVAMAGLLSVVVIVTIASFINREGFADLIRMGKYFVAFQLLPLSRLDGGRLFFASVPMYIFTIAISIAAFAFAGTVSLPLTIIIAIVIGVLAVAGYFLHKFYL